MAAPGRMKSSKVSLASSASSFKVSVSSNLQVLHGKESASSIVIALFHNLTHIFTERAPCCCCLFYEF